MFIHIFNQVYGDAANATAIVLSDVSSYGSADLPHVAWRWGSVDQGTILDGTVNATYPLFTIASESSLGRYTVDILVSMC
jgi:hypothetical protein